MRAIDPQCPGDDHLLSRVMERSDDPFLLLGLPATYALDLREAEQRHRDLSQALHPDRYAGASASERRLALNRAMTVNQAFRMVKDPVQRAEALLRHLGLGGSEAELESARGETEPSFLMRVMEEREALNAAGAARDLERVQELLGLALATQHELMDELARLFEQLAPASNGGTPADAADDQRTTTLIRQKLAELRFNRRFIEEGRAIEEELA